MNTQTLILCGIAFFAYLVIMISIPFRTKKIRQQAGQLILPLKNSTSAKWIFIAVIAVALIWVIPFRDMGLFVNVILLFVALIAAEMAAREGANRGLAGVYKDAIVLGTQTVYIMNIESLPTLAYENDPESTGDYKTSLSIIQRNGTETTLVFADESDRANAVKTVLDIAPRLKP